MRAFLVSALVLCWAAPALSAQRPDNAAEAARIDSLQNAGQDNWKGRHHYLYDNEYQPETTGAAPGAMLGAKPCADEVVRMQRSDGKTTIRHINRCG